MTKTTARHEAEFIAPLGTYPSCSLACPLEKTILVITRQDVERCLTVWTKPDCLASVIKARRALAPGWSIQETLGDYPVEAT